MPTDPLLESPDLRHADNRLLETLQRRRDEATDRAPYHPGHRVDAATALVEQAKGALMLRYGVDSYQALALLVRWARVTHTPVTTIAHLLLRGICEGNPQAEVRHRTLIRWLEAQLRDGHPDLAPPTTTPVRPRRTHETPPSR